MNRSRNFQLLRIAALAATLAATPAMASVAMKVPGSCGLVQTTVCSEPGSLLEYITRWLQA